MSPVPLNNSSVAASRAAHNVISPLGAEISSGLTGVFRGEAVKQAFVNSKIADAARLTPSSFQQNDFRTIATRKVRQGQGVDYDVVTRIADYHNDKLPNMEIDKADLSRLIAMSREGLGKESGAGRSSGRSSYGAVHDPTAGDSEKFIKDHASLIAREKRSSVKMDSEQDDLQSARRDRLGRDAADSLNATGAVRDPTEGDAKRYADTYSSLMASTRGSKRTKREFDANRSSAWSLLLAEIREMAGGDITHEYAIVEMLREYFEAEIAKEERKKEAVLEEEEILSFLNKLASSFETEELLREIKAGYAAARIASQQADTMETNPAAIREAYRDMLRVKVGDYGTLFDKLAKFKRLGEDYRGVIDIFMQTVGEDIRSTSPSTDPNFLHSLLSELGNLKKLQTVHEETQKIVDDTRRIVSVDDRMRLDATRITSDLLHFCAKRGPSLSETLALLGPLHEEATPISKLMLANGIQRLHGKMPEEVIESVEARREQSCSLQFVIDRSVDDEDRAAEEAG